MRKLIRNVSIKIPSSNVLRIPGLIMEFKHLNSNMEHWRLTLKGSLFFWDTLYLSVFCPYGVKNISFSN